MNDETPYHIGQPGESWGHAERVQWLNEQHVKRHYKADVLTQFEYVSRVFTRHQYGALDCDTERYPLIAFVSELNHQKPTALITGGVHGYETSGVHGALRFLTHRAADYTDAFNLVVAPCISPWGYETINRWNPHAVDPNRSFVKDSPAQESAALMAFVASLKTPITVHIDLHETTDTDNTEFRPALAARDNVHHAFWEIPDGFYLVGDTENPCEAFQTAIVQAVSQVTHIAPSDASGRIIGELIAQPGVINYPTQALGLCTGFTAADFNTTTEVYPDSPKVDDENCILAQVAAVTGGLDFILKSA